MSTLGKRVHLNRIFSHPSGRILAVAADHMINYAVGMPEGLRHIEQTIAEIVEGRPSSITVNKGIALRCMERFAGRVPFIVQQMALTLRFPGFAAHVEVEEAVAMGADAIAVSIFVKSDAELETMKRLATTVREAERFGLPVIPHIYPLVMKDGVPSVSNTPEDVFYAVRVGLEMGADVIKAPYTGDPASFGDIVSVTPVPVVTAGGPQCNTLEEAEAMFRDVARSGAAGTTVGRNAWGFSDIPRTIRRLKAALGMDD
ncbi:MAG TPA: aldolase [Candidatus Hydrogenedentes bacterium]|nr:aldolase [Candidatus Hydrogenedentota bacterium]HPG67033.1 aldolase [Candidatus Hydrogenedentota bacterium]